MKYKAVTVGLVLAGTALGSAALNLGRARGAAWIGQPLELLVPVQLDPGQADAALCAEADVFHGDNRQEAGRVQVQTLSSDQPDTVNLKISSSAPVDEPVVSVYLRAGCSQKSSRKFVLLAELPNDIAASPSRVAAPTVSLAPKDAAPATPAPQTLRDKAPSAPVAKARVKKSIQELPQEPEQQAVKQVAVKKEGRSKAEKHAKAQTKTRSEGKPRLRLDPDEMETMSQRIKTLEASTTAGSLQDDITRHGQKLQAIQSELRPLLDQASKNEASLAAIGERLGKIESARVPVAVVYGLAALLVLALGALAYLWNKRPRPVSGKGPDWRTASSKSVDLDLDLGE